MAAISDTTRARIKAFLEAFVEGVVRQYRGRVIPRHGTPREYLAGKSARGELKPFHSAIMPPELMRLSAFERGFSTTLGTTFEECARLIAADHHAIAQRGYAVSGRVSLSAVDEIERQVTLFERAVTSREHRPTLTDMIDTVLRVRDMDTLEERSARVDLYVQTKSGQELYFEMKAPCPNKGQCLEITQRILRFHLVRGQKRPYVQAYLALPYNPFGPSRADYTWSFARNYTPFDEAVLVGPEFWEMLGGPTAYEELVAIYQEVGREKGKYIIDALAFGF